MPGSIISKLSIGFDVGSYGSVPALISASSRMPSLSSSRSALSPIPSSSLSANSSGFESKASSSSGTPSLSKSPGDESLGRMSTLSLYPSLSKSKR